jgi:hypothetical protein
MAGLLEGQDRAGKALGQERGQSLRAGFYGQGGDITAQTRTVRKPAT